MRRQTCGLDGAVVGNTGSFGMFHCAMYEKRPMKIGINISYTS